MWRPPAVRSAAGRGRPQGRGPGPAGAPQGITTARGLVLATTDGPRPKPGPPLPPGPYRHPRAIPLTRGEMGAWSGMAAPLTGLQPASAVPACPAPLTLYPPSRWAEGGGAGCVVVLPPPPPRRRERPGGRWAAEGSRGWKGPFLSSSSSSSSSVPFWVPGDGVAGRGWVLPLRVCVCVVVEGAWSGEGWALRGWAGVMWGCGVLWQGSKVWGGWRRVWGGGEGSWGLEGCGDGVGVSKGWCVCWGWDPGVGM